MFNFNKKRNQKGTSLLEMLVYLSCWTCIFSLMGYQSVKISQELQAQNKRIDRWIELALAMNTLMSDINRASTTNWKVKEKESIIFTIQPLEMKCNTQSMIAMPINVGWHINNGRLIRSIGRYSSSQQEWIKRSKSVILENVESICFDFMYRGSKVSGVKTVTSVKAHKNVIKLESVAACKEDEE